MIGLSPRTYVKDNYNLFDLVTVVMSLVELGFSSDGGGSLGALRAIRLFRVFKLFKSGDLRILMDSIAFTVSTIGNYTVLLCLFLYVFSLMGMSFFAGYFKFEDNGEGPPNLETGTLARTNFDTLFWATITVFSCMIGDNWTYIMYDAMRARGAIYSIYFIAVIAFGNVIMLNLFLAILLGNFDRARDFGAKKKLFQCFIDLREAGYDLSQCIDAILEEISDYVKTGILKWPKHAIYYEQEENNSYVRSVLGRNGRFMTEFEDMDGPNLLVQNLYELESLERKEAGEEDAEKSDADSFPIQSASSLLHTDKSLDDSN